MADSLQGRADFVLMTLEQKSKIRAAGDEHARWFLDGVSFCWNSKDVMIDIKLAEILADYDPNP